MDPQMRAMMEEQKQARLTQLRNEMAWELEKHKIAHHKLRDRFLTPVDQSRIVVKALLSGHQVSTLRQSKFSKEFTAHTTMLLYPAAMLGVAASRARHTLSQAKLNVKLAEEERLADQAHLDAAHAHAHQTGADKVDASESMVKSRLDAAKSKAEERAKRKEERKKLWDALMAVKPDEKHINPEDLEVCMCSNS